MSAFQFGRTPLLPLQHLSFLRYAAQLLVADGVTLNGTLAFSDNAKIKTLIYRGSNVWSVLGG